MQRHRLICDNKKCTFFKQHPDGMEIDPKDFHKALRLEIPCEKCSRPMKLQKDNGLSWSYVDFRQKGVFMKNCFLCKTDAEIEERGTDLHVVCKGECGPGPYLISRLEMNKVSGIRGKKVHGRRQHYLDEVKRLRDKDPNRLIVIRDGKVGFAPPNG